MGKNKFKLENRIVLLKLPNGNEFLIEYWNKGLSICAKNSEKKLKVKKFTSNAIVIKLK